MRNRVLLSSAALMLVMGTASFAQTQRGEPMQSPPGAQGERSLPDAERPRGGAQQPGARQPLQQRQPQMQDQAPRAQDQRGLQAPTAQDQRERMPSTAQPRRGQPDQPARAQERMTPQQPSAQSPARGDQPSRAQAPADRRSGEAQITTEQQTRISRGLGRDVHRIAEASFDVRTGAIVPPSARFVPLPSSIVSIVPQYRGYHYAVVRDEIVIIEPGTRRVVHVMPYGGGGRAAVTTKRKINLSPANRDYVRQNIRTRSQAVETTGAGTTEIEIGETLPRTMVIERFPDTVYRRVPELRTYQYIQHEDDIYLVDRERRVIDVIE